jgi:RNA polymerase sigma-70 factor (ECF subfamily)
VRDPTEDEPSMHPQASHSALAELFSAHRPRLERMVKFRLEPLLRARIDPSDVLQEAFMKLARREEAGSRDPEVPFYVWARQITLQTLIDLQRVAMSERRDPRREAPPPRQTGGDSTSLSIVGALVGERTSPSGAAIRQERRDRLHAVLGGMDELDREVLALRHFEQLGNKEVAQVLGVRETAASNRYVRALGRLADALADVPEFEDPR